MEFIKKVFKQITTTGTTTGCTECAVIIPDTGATAFYCFKICLTQEAPDIGFFDAYLPSITSLIDIYETTGIFSTEIIT